MLASAAGYPVRFGHSTGYRQTGTAPLDNAISHNGTDIEDFGLPENLMIAIAVLDTAGRFVTREVPSDRRLSDLAAFEASLALAREALIAGR